MTAENLLRGFTIRTRMLGAIAMVLALLVAIGSAGAFGIWRVQQANQSFATNTIAESESLTRLRSAMGDLRRYEKDMVINYEKTDEVTTYRSKWDAKYAEALKLIDEMLAGEEDVDNVVLRKLRPMVEAYHAAALPVFAQLAQSGYDNATVANRMLAKAKQSVRGAETLLDELSDALASESRSTTAEIGAIAQTTLVSFVALVLLGSLVVVPLTLLNSRSIVRPVQHAQDIAQAIAAGDLTRRITVEGRDEASQLLEALRRMQDFLRDLVGQVRASGEQIGTASVEIATGNQDLSARTEQAASNLQQTASSMEQLTGTVKQSADSARQANQLAASAAEVAQRGGSVVSQVVSTMDEINASSKKISDIIGVIDGIAFQTNILALNAAVEAARAGEQGRGFAVVASEVRSLAQRSAEAAKEIKGLINASVERVEVGSRLVADAGQTMDEIVGSVQRVSDVIGEITTASSEQRDGIGQVNTAVTQLDQMTQQNAALVEQSTAAAESLRQQAQRLSEALAGFRLAAA